MAPDNDEILRQLTTNHRTQYVGFVDILGFGDLVLDNPVNAIDVYCAIIRASKVLRNQFPKNMPQYVVAEMQFWSDSAVVVSPELRAVIETCQDLQTGAMLAADTLVRGCIAKGGYTDCRSDEGRFVVSDALVRAVRGEKTAFHPRIVLDRESGAELEAEALIRNGFSGALWSDDGHVMVQPFLPDFEKTGPHDRSGLDWYGPVLDRLVEKNAASKHRSKYEWMRSQLRRVDEHMDELREMDPANDPD